MKSFDLCFGYEPFYKEIQIWSMRIRILISGQPDPVLFSSETDPTCNNGYFNLEQNINQNQQIQA